MSWRPQVIRLKIYDHRLSEYRLGYCIGIALMYKQAQGYKAFELMCHAVRLFMGFRRIAVWKFSRYIQFHLQTVRNGWHHSWSYYWMDLNILWWLFQRINVRLHINRRVPEFRIKLFRSKWTVLSSKQPELVPKTILVSSNFIPVLKLQNVTGFPHF